MSDEAEEAVNRYHSAEMVGIAEYWFFEGFAGTGAFVSSHGPLIIMERYDEEVVWRRK